MVSPKDVKILVVDDEEDLRETISKLFNMFGFSIIEAGNGEEAWSVIQSQPIDLVLTDIRMPKCDGIELLRRIRSRSRTSPPVLVITGFNDHSQEELFDLGADGFFDKPFNASSVKDAVQKALLRRFDAWSRKVARPPAERINRQYQNLGQMIRDPGFQFGRNGVFVAMKFDQPQVQSIVAIDVKIEDANPCSRFLGTGLVRWTRAKERDGLQAGFGMEILYIDQHCREEFLKVLTEVNPLPFIPKGTFR